MTDPFDLRLESDCLDQLALDRLLAGECQGLAAARSHIDRCPRCTARFETLLREQAEYMTHARVTPAVVAIGDRLAQRRSSPWARLLRPWTAWSVAGVGAAAAVFALMALPRGDRAREESIRLKGGFQLAVLRVGENSIARPVAPGDRLTAGDKIVFRVTTPETGTVHLFSRSGEQPPVVLGSFEAPAGEPWQLPLSATLDEGRDEELVIAVFCRSPVPAAQIEARVREASPRDAGVVRLALPDCESRSLLLRRTPAPAPD